MASLHPYSHTVPHHFIALVTKYYIKLQMKWLLQAKHKDTSTWLEILTYKLNQNENIYTCILHQKHLRMIELSPGQHVTI